MSDTTRIACPACTAVNRVPSARLDQGPRCGSCKKPLFTGHPVELSAGGLEKVVAGSDIPVLVDFWASWCAPCRAMAPVFAEAAARMEPAVRLAKLDTEAEPQVAARYGISGIPTLIIFKGGREVARRSGAMDLGGLVNWVRSLL